ncbi:MAG: DUF1015 family protein [Fibrobacterota bacterium]
MAFIKPFRGLRPRPDLTPRVAAVPYDVVNTEEARALAMGNPYSLLHVSRPEIDLPAGTDIHSDSVYVQAKTAFERFKKEGTLQFDPEERLYLYSQRMGAHTQVGLAAAFCIDEYDNNLIKKHEKTREDKENDRARHTLTLRANTGPVFLCYRHNVAIDSLVQRLTTAAPDSRFTAPDGIEHAFWVVKDAVDIRGLVEAFGKIPALYIADGHHRNASASRTRSILRKENPGHTGREPYNHYLAVAFPDNQLRILPYNRLLKDLNGLSEADFLKRVAEKFDIVKNGAKTPATATQFSMYLSRTWVTLVAKAGTFDPADPIGSLDVSILQDNLLGPVLGIDNPRTSKRIDFVGGIRGTDELEKRVNSGEMAAAFSMFPTSLPQLFAIADAGAVMPPKSTWFEPKLRSGLVLYTF